MRKLAHCLAALLAAGTPVRLLWAQSSKASAPAAPSRDWTYRSVTRTESIDLSGWSLEDKAGQLLLVGFRSLDQIRAIRPAGVILFAWNMPSVERTKELTLKLETLAREEQKESFFIATDHEGGEVLRLRKGLTAFPDAAAVGATGDSLTAFQVGKAMGHELAALGINMNLAPVMDLGNARSFLRNRVWGEDGGPVGQLTTAYIRGLQAARVLAVAKHFPGHGGSTEDSHFALPKILKPFAAFWKEDLEPFRQAVREGVQAVMTAHVEVPAIDRGPASLSEKFVTQVLRKELGYEGLVLTDDVEMAGVAGIRATPVEDLALRALKAGTDLVMVVWSESKQRRIRDRIVRAVQSGEVRMEWLDEKVRRIIAARRAYVPPTGEHWDNPFWQENLRRPEFLELSQSIPRRALHWIAGDAKAIVPSFGRAWEKSWLVVVPSPGAAKYWRGFRSKDEIFTLSRRPPARELESLRSLLKAAAEDGRPLLVVTGPRASSTEASFQVVRDELGRRGVKRRGTGEAVLWVHQGSRPVDVKRDPASLGIGIVGLHSASIASLMALSTYLREGMTKDSSEGGAWN